MKIQIVAITLLGLLGCVSMPEMRGVVVSRFEYERVIASARVSGELCGESITLIVACPKDADVEGRKCFRIYTEGDSPETPGSQYREVLIRAGSVIISPRREDFSDDEILEVTSGCGR